MDTLETAEPPGKTFLEVVQNAENPQIIEQLLHNQIEEIAAAHPEDRQTYIAELAHGIFHLISEKKKAEEQAAQAERLADHDLLCPELLNNQGFKKEVNRMIRHGKRQIEGKGPFPNLIILFIDLDDFKMIDDAFGHTFGDEFLKYIGVAIARGIRPEDFAAHISGDEFAIGLVNIKNEKDLLKVIDRIRKFTKCLPRVKVAVEGYPWDQKSSIGISRLRPGDRSAEEVIDRADIAMYQAKNLPGKDQTVEYKEGMVGKRPLVATARKEFKLAPV